MTLDKTSRSGSNSVQAIRKFWKISETENFQNLSQLVTRSSSIFWFSQIDGHQMKMKLHGDFISNIISMILGEMQKFFMKNKSNPGTELLSGVC